MEGVSLNPLRDLLQCFDQVHVTVGVSQPSSRLSGNFAIVRFLSLTFNAKYAANRICHSSRLDMSPSRYSRKADKGTVEA